MKYAQITMSGTISFRGLNQQISKIELGKTGIFAAQLAVLANYYKIDVSFFYKNREHFLSLIKAFKLKIKMHNWVCSGII